MKELFWGAVGMLVFAAGMWSVPIFRFAVRLLYRTMEEVRKKLVRGLYK